MVQSDARTAKTKKQCLALLCQESPLWIATKMVNNVVRQVLMDTPHESSLMDLAQKARNHLRTSLPKLVANMQHKQQQDLKHRIITKKSIIVANMIDFLYTLSKLIYQIIL